MKHLELVFINLNQRVDLLDDNTLQMIYQIMTDISTKGGTFSYDMSLAGSGNNNIIFNELFDEHFYLPDTGTTTFINKSIPAHIDFDGLPFIYGQFVLTEVDNDNGQLTYIGHFTTELRSFGDQLGDYKIVGNDLDPTQNPANSTGSTYDIDFSEYNHVFTWTNIDLTNSTSAITVDLGNGHLFPNLYNNSIGPYYGMIDMEGPNSINLVETNRVLVQNFRPCIYARELWQKIWNKTTYKYQSNFIDSSYFGSLVIPYTFDNSQVGNQRNLDGSSDQEFNVGVSYTGSTPTDFSGYGPITTRANSLGFQGRSLNSSSESESGGNPTNCVVAYVLTGGTSALNTNYFTNKDVTYTKTVCSTNHTWYGNSVPTCTQPFWTVTENGNYDLIANIDYNIYWQSSNVGVTSYLGQSTDYIGVSLSLYSLQTDGSVRCIQRASTSHYMFNVYVYNNQFIFSTQQNLVCELDGVDLVAGEKIFVVATIQNTLHTQLNYAYLNCLTGFSFFKNKYNSSTYFNYGQNVDMNKILPPNYNQVDYIKDIMNYFNLVAQPIQGTNIIRVEPWDAFYNISGTTDYIEWRGMNADKIDNSQTKTIESIPDLLYQDFWLNPKSDGNDTNTSEYKIRNNIEFGCVNVRNPYIKSDSKIVTTNFASTMMSQYGMTNWRMAQLWNKDKQPTDINVPPEQTYEPRLLFRKKILATTSNNLNKMYAFGNAGGCYGHSTTTNTVVNSGTLANNFHLDTNPDGTYPYFPLNNTTDGIIMNEDNNSIFMMGNFVGYNPGTGMINMNVTYSEGSGSYSNWFLSTITDKTFGLGGTYPYQPYIGTLDDPISPTFDINFGKANYYLMSAPNASDNNVFNIFWKNKVMTYIDPNSKYVTYYVWLNISDIMNLDFGKKILIDNNLYILSKVTWTPNKSAKCEMIRLTDYPSSAAASSYYLPGGGGAVSNSGQTWNQGGTNGPQGGNRSQGQTMELYSQQGVQTNSIGVSGITLSIIDAKNYFPQTSAGIINGRSNNVTGDNYHLLNSNGNTVNADNITSINSHGNVITHDSNVYINTTGVTSTDTGKTFINARDVSTLTDITYVNTGLSNANKYTDTQVSGVTTYVDNNFYSTNSDIIMTGNTNLILMGGDIYVPARSYIYFGDPRTSGSIRISVLSLGNSLAIEKFNGFTWTCTSTFVCP